MDFEGFKKKLMGMFFEHQIERISRSWCVVGRPERKMRLRAVQALSVELDRIQKVDIFSTAIGESVIEDIIQGDWKSAKSTIDWWKFEDERPETRDRYAPLWEGFRVTLQTMCAEAERVQEGVIPRSN